MKRLIVVLGVVTASAGAAVLTPGQGAPAIETRPSFDIAVPHAPAPVRIGRDRRLRYELHLTNFASRPLGVERVRVTDAAGGRVLTDLAGDALTSAMVPVAPLPNARQILPGGRAIVYLDAMLEGPVPTSVRHHVDYVSDEATRVSGAIRSGEQAVDARPLPILSPPLRGGPWTAVHHPAIERGHRRVIYTMAGRARIPGRFAIDWMRAGAPDGGKVEDGLGAEVLAVADGVVASTRDGVPEPPPGALRPRVGLADATGNYISLDLGGGRYAFYEHLLPGLLVRPGQSVRRGQVIARLGSTGQASRPHLHFHVADADSPLGAEGLPYLLKGFSVVGSYPSLADFQASRPWTAAGGGAASPALPAPYTIVSFDERESRKTAARHCDPPVRSRSEAAARSAFSSSRPGQC